MDLLQALCAIAALFIPLGFVWFALSRTARRHGHHRPRGPARSKGPADQRVPPER